jgi:hypothetical protein
LDLVSEAAQIEKEAGELNYLTERRVRQRNEANSVAEAWAASERAFYERIQEEHRLEWHSFHLDQAERIERTAAELAESHRAKAQELLNENK